MLVDLGVADVKDFVIVAGSSDASNAVASAIAVVGRRAGMLVGGSSLLFNVNVVINCGHCGCMMRFDEVKAGV